MVPALLAADRIAREPREAVTSALLIGILAGGVAAGIARGRRAGAVAAAGLAAAGICGAWIAPLPLSLSAAALAGALVASVDVAARPRRRGTGNSAWGWGERWERFAFAGGARAGAGAGAGGASRSWKRRDAFALDAGHRLEIERAIVEQERESGGEIVAAVVPACEDDTALACRVAAWLAAVTAGGAWSTGLALPAWGWVAVAGLGGFAGHRMARTSAFRRWLLAPARRTERAERRARRAFAEAGLGRSPGRVGVLLFVALLERRVVVLAGEGIHGRLGPGESWDDVAREMAARLEAGELAGALVSGARAAGALLRRHLPSAGRPLAALPAPLLLLRDDL